MQMRSLLDRIKERIAVSSNSCDTKQRIQDEYAILKQFLSTFLKYKSLHNTTSRTLTSRILNIP